MEMIEVPKSLLHRIADADDPNPPEDQLQEIRDVINVLLEVDAFGTDVSYRLRRVHEMLHADPPWTPEHAGRVFGQSMYWTENMADLAAMHFGDGQPA